VLTLVAACGLVLATGCGPKKRPTHAATQRNQQPEVMNNVDERMSELRKRASELTQAVQQLPGRSPAEDRKLVADAFGKASSSLELLGGPQPGGAFRQELRIIENTRTFLNSPGSASVAPDPSIDTGLRSLDNALSGVRERLFPNDEKIKGGIDTLRTKLGELDSVRGPIHSLVVAQAFLSAASVIDTMSAELDARTMAQQPAPSAPPRAPMQPAAVPAAAPVPPVPPAPPVAPAAPAPPAPPAPPVAPAPPAAPSSAGSATPQATPTPQQYEELQRKYEQLQREVEQMKRQQQRQQQPAVPPPAPAPAPAPAR